MGIYSAAIHILHFDFINGYRAFFHLFTFPRTENPSPSSPLRQRLSLLLTSPQHRISAHNQSTTMPTSRIGLRFFQNSRAAFRNATGPFRRPGFRFQSSEAGAAAAESQPQSVFQRLWNSPVGVKTVHFW